MQTRINKFQKYPTHPTTAFLQLIIDKQRQIFRWFVVQIQEVLEIRRNHVLEYFVIVEGVHEEMVEPILQIEQILHKCNRIDALVLFFNHNKASALFTQITGHTFSNCFERIVMQPWEQFIHACQILCFCVLNHVYNAAILHFNDGFHMFVNKLILDHFDNTWLCFLIQIEFGSLRFFCYAALRGWGWKIWVSLFRNGLYISLRATEIVDYNQFDLVDC